MRVSKGTIVVVLVALCVCILLAVLLERWPPFQAFRQAYPFLARIIPLAAMVVVAILGALLLPSARCSQCRRTYKDFAIDLDHGRIRCVACGHSADIGQELGREQALFILDTMLAKDNLPDDQRTQVEELKGMIAAT